jgi:hypothetical protein
LLRCKEPSGQDAYQVTKFGETVVDGFLAERMKRVVAKWLSKVLEEYALLIIIFLLGVLISSLFGFDIKALRNP